MPPRLTIAAIAVAALLAVASITTARAQTPPPPLQAGDIVWAFAKDGPLRDERVSGAIGSAMESRIQLPSDARVARVNAHGPDEFQLEHVYSADEVSLLLAASGFGNTPPFVEVGQCRVWAQPAEGSGLTPADIAPVLATALHDTLAGFGVQAQPCAVTSDPAQAHLLVWVHGKATPALLPERREPTFLTDPSTPAGPSGPPPHGPLSPPLATPPPLRGGDIVWTFASEDPLYDPRIAAALGTLMAPIIEAGQPAGTRVVRVQQEGPGVFVPGTIYPASDVPKLLAAAGFGNTPPFIELGQCTRWSTPDATVPTVFTPSRAAALIGAALDQALASLGVQARPCAFTQNPAVAHVVVWTWTSSGGGPPPPALAQRPQSTFLSGTPGVARPPGAGAPAAQGGGHPRPAVTGNAGIEDDARGSVNVAAGAVFAIALVLGAGLLPRHGRGRS